MKKKLFLHGYYEISHTSFPFYSYFEGWTCIIKIKVMKKRYLLLSGHNAPPSGREWDQEIFRNTWQCITGPSLSPLIYLFYYRIPSDLLTCASSHKTATLKDGGPIDRSWIIVYGILFHIIWIEKEYIFIF